MKRLSALIICRDEEKNLRPCLDSVSFADEIIIVDSGSKDGSLALARGYTDKVFEIEWRGYAGTKQYGLERATGDWVLWVDADERVPPRLAEEILLSVQRDEEVAAYRMPRRAFFLGRWIKHCGWYPGNVTRLFRRGQARFGDQAVHEDLLVDGPVGTLSESLDHYTDPNIYHYFEKLNRYTSLAAGEMHQKGRRVTIPGILLRPVHMFLRMYVFKAGFLDGWQGFLLSCFSSAYVLVKYAKLWEAGRAARNAEFQGE